MGDGLTFQTYPIADAGLATGHASIKNNRRQGIYYVGEMVVMSIHQAATVVSETWEVRDYFGTVVKTGVSPYGSASGATVNLADDFDPGWYRAYFNASSSTTTEGYARGHCNFIVVKPHGNLPTIPTTTWAAPFDSPKPSGIGATDAEVDGLFSGSLAPWFESPTDMITRACMGMGVGRLSHLDAANPLPDTLGISGSDRLADNKRFAQTVLQDWWLNPANPDWVDPVRERQAWLAFPNYVPSAMYDYNWTASSGDWGVTFTLKYANLDGDKVFLQGGPATSSGYRIRVFYPDSSTLVEDYDNLVIGSSGSGVAAAQTALNASNYLRATVVFSTIDQTTFGPTAIGWDSRRGVEEIVETLYPLGVTRFEGPVNEQTPGPGLAHLCYLGHTAVHAGHPDAKFIGPCTVNITDLDAWRSFFDAGGGDYLDEISFHDYNSIAGGDINLGRNTIEAFIQMLTEYDQHLKPRWQTEATHSMCSQSFGVYHPRRARHTILAVLLWEQYGVPMERNTYWYDYNHGFWGYSCFMFNNNFSSNPQVVLWRVLAEEIFGKLFHHRVDFGSVPANRIFLGNVYGDATKDGGSVMALVCASAMPGSTVTLAIEGTSADIEVVSGLGVESTVAQSGGLITVDVLEIPTYVRLPKGVNAYVHSVRDWDPVVNPSVSATKVSAFVGGVNAAVIADEQTMQQYGNTSDSIGIVFSDSGLPDSADVLFADDVEVERVIIFNGPAYQSMPGLLDYDIDTWDGSSWTTRETVTKDTPSSFLSGGVDTGCQRETYWDEQWIEDVKLSSPVTCKGVRVYVREATYGGEPDLAAVTDGSVTISVGGMVTPKIAIQEISILSPTSVTPPAAWTDAVAALGPVGWWRLGEASGTTAVSQVNSPTLNGTYTGSFIYGEGGMVTDGDTAVTTSGAASVVVPHNALLNAADVFSFVCWYRPNDTFTGQFRTLFTKGTFGPSFGVNTTGNLYLYRESGGIIVATSSSPLSVGVEAMCAVVKNGSSTKLFINGVDVTTAGTDVTFGNTSNNLTLLGASKNSGDEFMYFTKALSDSEVLNLYRSGSAPGALFNVSDPVIES